MTGCTLRSPEAPTGVSAIARNAYVTLFWTQPEGATEYEIGISESSGGPYTPKGGTEETQFDADELTNGTTYYFVVKAGNDKGWSDYSNEVSATPQPAPLPIGDLTAMAGDGTVTLSWTAPAGATTYAVYWRMNETGSWAGLGTTSDTSFVKTGLQNGTRYYFAVCAGSSYGWSTYSNTASAIPGN